MEQVYDSEKLQLASSWKAEKVALEADREKLRKELDFTKSNLERFLNLCSLHIPCEINLLCAHVCLL